MSQKKIFAYLNVQNEAKDVIISQMDFYDSNGVDGVFIYNYAQEEKEREEFVLLLREISELVDIPFYAGCYIDRLEDVKKIYYAGAEKVVLDSRYMSKVELIKEAVTKIGAEQVLLQINGALAENHYEDCFAMGVSGIVAKDVILDSECFNKVKELSYPVMIFDSLQKNSINDLLEVAEVNAVATNAYRGKDVYSLKYALKEQGIDVKTTESPIAFADMKKDANGLIPVIVQDYKTNEVLMLAYMNEEAYNTTIRTGKMTYYSRSRKELWIKGLTSGHYQYVKALSIDCDEDTILAKVKQIGVACHTGNRSCFYRDLVKTEWKVEDNTNILEKIYATVMDRKQNPKEGSYTNYLFNKGIDKILKKCGEEATEIVIAAKNPDKTEIKYEIADFLYHVTVLMAECGIDWKDVFTELANRD